MPEKIGSDVLGGEPEPRMSQKKRKELEEKFRAEQAKLRAEERKKLKVIIEEVPMESIPGEIPHEATSEERGGIIDKEQKKKKRTVHVTEHYRTPPGDQSKAEDI